MKKKILFYGSLAEGGIGRVMVDLINHLSESKYDITVMSRFPGGYYSNYFNNSIKVKHNVPFKETSSKLYNHLVRVICDKLPRKIIYKIFIHKKYDVEIACDDAFSTTLIGGSTNKKSKKILWEHMDVTKDKSVATSFSKEKKDCFFSPFDEIVAVSRECKEKFEEKYGFREKTSFIYNPIDVKNIEELSREEKSITLNSDIFTMVCLGRFMPQKAFIRLTEVCKTLKEKGYTFKLIILGDGPEKPVVDEMIKTYRLEDYVILGGYQINPYPFIKDADMLICASIHESYCLSVAESIVLGTPVLSTKCTGPNELLEYGKYGILVENTKEGLERGISRVLDNPLLLTEFKDKIKERKEFFSLEKAVERWECLLDEEEL